MDRSKPDDMKRKKVDCKLVKKFNWKAKNSLEFGLQQMLDHYIKEVIS